MTSKKGKGIRTRTGRYRILCRSLSYPTSQAAIDRILAGDHSDEARAERDRSMERHYQGEIVDNIPPESVPHELEAGNIEEVR